MKNEYGYLCANSIVTLGTREYVKSFFEVCDIYLVNSEYWSRFDWTTITDRLYRRVFHAKDVDAGIGVIFRALDALSETKFSDVKSSTIRDALLQSGQSIAGETTLNQCYHKFGDEFVRCGSWMISNLINGHDFHPIRIGRTSIPEAILDGNHPASDYEALGPSDLPFWLR